MRNAIRVSEAANSPRSTSFIDLKFQGPVSTATRTYSAHSHTSSFHYGFHFSKSTDVSMGSPAAGGGGLGLKGMFARDVIPPSMVRILPLIHPEAVFEHKNATAFATSSTLPIRPTGKWGSHWCGKNNGNWGSDVCRGWG